MKRSILILLATAFFLSAQTLSAQFTLRLAGGYAGPGFQASEGIIGPIIDPLHPDVDALGALANIQTDTSTGKTTKYQPIKGSYGRGMNFTLGLGYTVCKYFNFELGISYLKSATMSADQTRQLALYDPVYHNYTYIPAYLWAHIATSAYGVSISPSFTVQAPIKHSKFMPYMRAGISMPILGKLTDNISIDQNSGLANLVKPPYFLGAHTDVTLVTEGTVSVGFNGALGVKYNVLPYLSVFAEINGQYLTTRSKSAKITRWDADGVSKLGSDPTVDRTTYRTQFTFVDQLTNSSNNDQYNANYSTSKAKEDIRPTGPFSNLGFNIGLTFSLSKKTLKKPDGNKKPESK